MKSRIIYFIASAFLVLSACKSDTIPEEGWCKLDPKSYQMLLQTASEQGASWTVTPLEIGRHFFYLREEGVTDHKVDMKEDGDIIGLTIINYGSADHSIKDQAYEIKFQKQDNVWVITQLRQSFSCREGRSGWSCERCK